MSQGQVWTVERFGAFTRLLQPGLNFVLPYVDHVGRKLNVQEQVVEIPEQSVITRDNATVAVDGIIYYRVMEPEKAAYQVTNLTLALTTLAMTNIRAVIGEMELDATLSSRERINTALLVILDGATMPWGVKVSRVEIRKIEPPENLIRAMNLQMTAERERRVAVARAEGERQAAILRAEGEKQALILSAEGRQQAANRDAEARVALARAEAEATQMVSDAATLHGQAGLRYFIADRYVRAFQALASAPNTRVVVVPMESAALAGGIVQAMQLFRGDDGTPGRRAARNAARRRPLQSCRRHCRRCPRRHLGEAARQDERLDHLDRRRPGVADARDPRPGCVHDVAGPGGLWHRTDCAGERDRLRIAGGDGRACWRRSRWRSGCGFAIPVRPWLNTQQAGLAGRSATALAFHGREGRVRVGDSDWAARVPPDVAGTSDRLEAARRRCRWYSVDRPPGGMS